MEIQVRVKDCPKCNNEGRTIKYDKGKDQTTITACNNCDADGYVIKWLPIDEALLHSKEFQSLIAKC